MPLLESLITGIGAAVAKGVLKMWLKEDSLILDTTLSTTDIFKVKLTDILHQNAADREFEKIRDRSATSFEKFLEKEQSELPEETIILIANAAAEVINNTKITAELVVDKNLDPGVLTHFFLTRSGADGGNPGMANNPDSVIKNLYERILLHASRQIVDVSSQFPRFNERIFSAILEGQDQIYKAAAQIMDGVDRIIADQKGIDFQAEQFETNYRLTCESRLDKLQLFGVDLQESNRRYNLSVAYVTLELENTSNKSENGEPNTDEQNNFGESLPVDQVISKSNRLLVRGPASSGKTTLLQWVAVYCAGKNHEGDLVALNDFVPFLIKLRDFDTEPLPSADGFSKLISSGLANEPEGWAHNILECGRGIILIDGLDEASEEQRETVRTWLQDLLIQYPNARYIVTTRPHAVKEGWLDDQSFVDASLQDMNRSDVSQFISHWHQAVATSLQGEQEKASLGQLSIALQRKVSKSSTLFKLATSPLLCAMLCALHRDRQQNLPDDRIALYRACIEMFFRREDEREIVTDDNINLTDEQKLLLLQSLAWWLIRNDKSSASPEQVFERLDHGLNEINNPSQDITGQQAANFFINRVGILRQFAADKIDFPHRTFQEYLAAGEAIAEDDLQLLLSNAEKELWREVAILAAGRIPVKTDAAKYVLAILNRGDEEKSQQQTLYLVGAAAFELVARFTEGESINTEVSKRLKKIIPPKSITAATELAAAGNLVVPLLEYNPQGLAKEVAASIRTLALVDTVEAIAILKDYANDRRVTVRNQFRTSLQYVSDEFRLSLLKKWLALDVEVIDLEGVELTDCNDFVDHQSLETLYLSRCNQLLDVNGLGECQSLQTLYLDDCTQVSDLSALSCCKSLQKLSLSGCTQLTDLGSLSDCYSLQSLDLWNCKQLADVSGLGGCESLQRLDLSCCTQIVDFSPLSDCSSLQRLDLFDCKQLTDLGWLQGCKTLQDLNLSGCTHLTDLSVLKDCKSLLRLDLSDCTQLIDTSSMSGCNSLEELNLSGCTHLTDLSGLKDCKSLLRLDLSGCTQIVDLSPLRDCNSLQNLDLWYCEQLTDLSGLGGCSSLQRLNLSACTQLTDLSALSNCKSLQDLDLSDCTQLTDLNSLSGCNSLESLELWDCNQLTNLSALSSCYLLNRLYLHRCSQLTDLRSLANCQSLTYLDLRYCPNISKKSIIELKKKLPDLKIHA